MVSEDEEVGDMEEVAVLYGCEEWHAGVFRADRPADKAM